MILSFTAIMLVTLSGIYGEVKKSQLLSNLIKTCTALKLATHDKVDTLELAKTIISFDFDMYRSKQTNYVKQTFECPFSGIRETVEQPVLINR